MAKKFGKIVLLTAAVTTAAAAAYYYLQKKDSGIPLKRKQDDDCGDCCFDAEDRTYVELNREDPEVEEPEAETAEAVEEFFNDETDSANQN